MTNYFYRIFLSHIPHLATLFRAFWLSEMGTIPLPSESSWASLEQVLPSKPILAQCIELSFWELWLIPQQNLFLSRKEEILSHLLWVLLYIHNSQVKLHRTLRTAAFWQEHWGFSHETAQNRLEESNRWTQHSRSPPWPHSFPTTQKPDRWPGSSRWQPRQSLCTYLGSPVRTTQKPPFAKPV